MKFADNSRASSGTIDILRQNRRVIIKSAIFITVIVGVIIEKNWRNTILKGATNGASSVKIEKSKKRDDRANKTIFAGWYVVFLILILFKTEQQEYKKSATLEIFLLMHRLIDSHIVNLCKFVAIEILYG